MTDEEREALVERVAEAIFNESGTARLQSWERYRAFYKERGVLSPDYYAQARAALVVAEPAVREDCARVLELAAARSDGPDRDGESNAAATMRRVAAETIRSHAAAIRAGARGDA